MPHFVPSGSDLLFCDIIVGEQLVGIKAEANNDCSYSCRITSKNVQIGINLNFLSVIGVIRNKPNFLSAGSFTPTILDVNMEFKLLLYFKLNNTLKVSFLPLHIWFTGKCSVASPQMLISGLSAVMLI